MLSIHNFEQYIDPKIVKRGKSYHDSGNVTFIEEVEDGFWEAQVEGSDDYEVEIHLQNDTVIEDYSCDCPYDDGDTCKHVVAVLYEIRQEVSLKSKKIIKITPKKVSSGDLFSKISFEELQAFVKKQIEANRDFKTTFEIYFADKDDSIDVEKKYRDLLKKIIKKHSDRGFVDYYATSKLAKEVEAMMSVGHEYLRKDQTKEAFSFAKAVLSEVTEIITDCDDSNGEIGGLICEAIEFLGDTVSQNTDKVLGEQTIDFIQDELKRRIYFDYGDYGGMLFDIYEKEMVKKRDKTSFFKFVDSITPPPEKQYADYERDMFRKSKIDFAIAIGDNEEAQRLTMKHLDIVAVRKQVVNKAIHEQDYSYAKQLIRDGISIAESKGHPGTVSDWNKQLMEIASVENDVETIRYFSKLFAFDRGFNLDNYRQWKSTFEPEEYALELEKLIQDMKSTNEKGYSSAYHTLPQLYIEEGMWENLWFHVKNTDFDNIWKYHKYLAKHFPDELLTKYLPALEKAGDIASGRGDYVDIVEKMKNILRDFPESKYEIQLIAKRLIEKYPRRKAMIEEFRVVIK